MLLYLDEKFNRGTTSDVSTISSDSHISFSPPPDISDTKNSGTLQKVSRLRGSRYRGVVPQPNGRWGAQIYEKNQRIWLGTYDKEDEAAKAYNIAVQCFRGQGASALNFFGTDMAVDSGDVDVDVDADAEAKFLMSHSKAEIVEMLRTHTYTDELQRIKQNFCNSMARSVGPSRKVLFQKMLTPSDVGRQNRLVIPKKHAEKYFPVQIRSGTQQPGARTTTDNAAGRTRSGTMLNFRDVDGGRVWRFRFSYWNRSRSYVLTRGWSRFVKEKKLQAGDMVSFQQSTGPDRRLYVDYSKQTTGAWEQPAKVMRLFGFDIDIGGADSECASFYHKEITEWNFNQSSTMID